MYGHTTNRENRNPRDTYPTPPEFVDVLLRNTDLDPDLPVVDFAVELEVGATLAPVFEEQGFQAQSVERDYFSFDAGEYGSHHHLTNPPYKFFTEWARKALQETPDGVVALLGPMHSLGGAKRHWKLWDEHPPSKVVVVVDRMRLPGGPSQYNHIWYIWEPDRRGECELRWDYAYQ